MREVSRNHKELQLDERSYSGERDKITIYISILTKREDQSERKRDGVGIELGKE